jgi:tetratricopeptide (TPR) repeat protein
MQATRPVLLAILMAATFMAPRDLPTAAASSDSGASLASNAPHSSTPAERAIELARHAIQKNPGYVQAHNDLAMALARRARESSDVSFYQKAEEALNRSFEVSPGNLEGRKARAWVLLGKHEFRAALEEAQAVNKRAPDDLMIYGLLTDAHAELGEYAEAEKACQWMLDLRPGDVGAETRAAYLRELFGDIEGALELMGSAYAKTPFNETEDRAWILTQIGHLQLLGGDAAGAAETLAEALALFPDYHYALAGLARVRQSQERHAEAADLLRRRYEGAPHPENRHALAEALDRAGQKEAAQREFAEFEKAALAESTRADNCNRELTLYYADRAGRPDEALRIASLELARRRDIYTLDAHAWALHKSGRHDEARRQIEAALAVGTRDPELLRHGAEILREAMRAGAALSLPAPAPAAGAAR